MIIAIDIETKEGLRAQADNFLLGCAVDEELRSKTFYTPESMWQYIVQKGKALNKQNKKLYVYGAFHQFDWNIYAPKKDIHIIQVGRNMFLKHYTEDDEDFKERCDAMERQGKPIPKEKRGFITFLDLFSVYNSSIRNSKYGGLKRVGELIKHLKQEMPESLKSEKGVYTPEELKKIEKYCVNDCVVVIKALHKIKEKLKSEGVRISTLYSIHQIAMNRLLYKLRKMSSKMLVEKKRGYMGFPSPKYPCRIKKGSEYHTRFCRGGIVQAYMTGEHNECFKIDCNGFWQWAVSVMPMPDLRSEHRIERPLRFLPLNEILEKIGYCHALIEVPETDFGVLPVRTDDGVQVRNMFPNHNCYIIGHYTNTELKYAVSQGYKIHEINYCVLFEESKENDIAKVAKETYELRKRSENEFDNWFYKQMGNSFIGKMTQCSPNYKTIKILPYEVEKYKKEGFEIVEAEGEYYIAQREEGIYERMYYAPIVYALTTAYARVEHLKVMKSFGTNKVAYVDTDSLILINTNEEEIRQKVRVSGRLGEWKFEHEDNENITPEKCVIWKEKYYKFGESVHMASISMEDALKVKSTDTEIVRKRMISEGMTDDESQVGLQKEEVISLETKDKVYQKVYIDNYSEYNKTLNLKLQELLEGYVKEPVKDETIQP